MRKTIQLGGMILGIIVLWETIHNPMAVPNVAVSVAQSGWQSFAGAPIPAKIAVGIASGVFLMLQFITLNWWGTQLTRMYTRNKQLSMRSVLTRGGGMSIGKYLFMGWSMPALGAIRALVFAASLASVGTNRDDKESEL